MKKLKVSVFARIRDNGKQRYVPAVWRNKKELKQGWAMVAPGKPEHRPESSYALRYTFGGKQRWEGIGQSATEAISARDTRQWQIRNMDTLPDLLKPAFAKEAETKPEEPKGGKGLAQQKEKFLELKRLTKKPDGTRLDKETLSAYQQVVEEFLALAGKQNASEIDGMDLRRYMAALEAQGKSHRTVCNRYVAVATFLKFCKVDHKELLPKGERPRPHDDDPEAYTLEEMLKFLQAVKRYRDRLFYEFLLKTGARTREATNARWTDLVGGSEPVFKIQNHEETQFRTKTGKSRAVPLERRLYEKLMMWREQNPGTKLIFGTKSDKPDRHFLEICKETARRAGLNCGECEGCLGKHKECGRWFLHKFRASFATWALRAGTDIRTVQGWMGHHSIQQTEKYTEKGKGAYAQKGINAAFGVSLE
ncbi:MAG: tyrosine-type recombinase/integrase, partial [Candidatus Angelobacter sp.]